MSNRIENWDREEKRRALSGCRFNPDFPTMASNDLFADRQANAVAGVFFLRMQAFENDEDAPKLQRVDTNAIVLYSETPGILFNAGADMHFWWLASAKLDGIIDQVLKNLCKLDRISDY